VDTRVVAALAKKAETNLPPMKSLGDLLMESVSSEPMMLIPGAKDQFAKAMKGMEGKMTARFQSESFRKDLWESLLENWRSRIQVGSDARLALSPVSTTIVDGTPEDPGRAVQGMMEGAEVANDVFLRSTPLGLGLAAGELVNMVGAKTTAMVRVSNPRDMETIQASESTVFWTRRKPSDLVLVRLQDDKGTPIAKFTKGIFFKRKFKPADEAIALESTQDGDAWSLRPKSSLIPGAYAFLMGGKNIVLIPFFVK
jgi:hypothetical protein